MACLHKRNELKCKFPPCPCKKCVGLRAQRLAGGFCGMPHDTPPEAPTAECCNHRNLTQCDCTLKEIGPPYRRKYSRQECKKLADKESDSEIEECDPNCSLSIFIINMVSFIALVVIGAIVFWLKMCYWTYILGLHIYHSNRSTQMTVLGLFGLLILCMCCTYAMGSSSKSGAKMMSAGNRCKGTECEAKAMEHTEIAIEDKGREIFKQSKLYGIPMDMKQPPAFLVYLRSLIFED